MRYSAYNSAEVRTPWYTHPGWLIVVSGIILVIIIIAATSFLLFNLRERDLAEKSRELEHLTSVLAEQIDRSLQLVTVIQTSAVKQIRPLGIESEAEFRRQLSGHGTYETLKNEVKMLPYLDSLVLTDAEGKLINFSRSWPAPTVNAPNRDPHEVFIANPHLTSLVGEPLRSPVTRGWKLPIARRVTSSDGALLGVITGVIALRYFENLFHNLVHAQSGSIALLRSDGTLLVRYPHQANAIGKRFPELAITKLLSYSDHGTAIPISVIDGKKRIIAVYKLAHYPLVLGATITTQEALANWRSGIFTTIGAALAIGLVVGSAVTLSIWLVGKKLREQGLQRDAALDHMSQALAMFDAERRLVVCNKRFAELYRLNEEQIKPGTAFLKVLEYRVAAGTAPADNQGYVKDRSAKAAKDQPYQVTDSLKDGRSISIVHTPMASGGWVATHEDVTERVRTEKALAQAHRDLTEKQFAIDQAVDVIITDAEGTITYANEQFCQSSGYKRSELLGKNPRIFNSGTHPKKFFRQMYKTITNGQVWRGEICNKARDGSLYWMDTTIVPQLGANDKPVAYMAIRVNVTTRKSAETKIAYLANHDALTGLHNRAIFNERLNEAFVHSRQRDETFAVLLLDLDGFKHVNDTLGHRAGDELLAELGNRLKSLLRENDVLARLGGDEFAIIQSVETNQQEEAAILATRLLEVVALPFDLNGHSVSIGVSVGIAIGPDDGASGEVLLQNADLALYHVKSEGRNNFCFFDKEMSSAASARLKLLNELRAAVFHNEFELHYQLIFDSKTLRPCGAEALVRWRHPVEGLISPDRFIPLAEDAGLMGPLGAWVLERACADAAMWPQDIKVAVNLSATQFRLNNLFDLILCALVESGLSPQRLELEITESILLQDTEHYRELIRKLKNLGISIVLDDFGTGYSSLSYLTAYPFNKIKIDKSFTKELTSRAECAAIVASTITLARGLDILVTAEGVETEQQFELLRVAGVQQIQGFLFARPKPVKELDFSPYGKTARSIEAA